MDRVYQDGLNIYAFKTGNIDVTYKMVDIKSNDWSQTCGKALSHEAISALEEYGAFRGVNIVDLKKFDGDIDLLKANFYALGNMLKHTLLGRKLH